MFIEALLCAAFFKGIEILERRQRKPEPPAPGGELVVGTSDTSLRGYEAAPARAAVFEADQERLFVVSSANLALAAVALSHPALFPVVLGGVIYASYPIYRRAVENLLTQGKIGNDLLVTLAFIVLAATGRVPALALGCWFYFLGNRVQRRAKAQAEARLSELFLQAPQLVWILHDTIEVSIPLNQLNKGDIVVARAGEIISTDGVVVDGQALVDQHLLTGESQPAEKGAGDTVLASTVVLAGRLHVRAESIGQKTTTARITAMLAAATDQKSSLQLKGEQWADQAALPLLATAGAAMLFVGPVSSGIVLSSSIGNRIRLLAPLGTLNYLRLASTYGFLVKDGRALERLQSVDTVLFDKTGTLTRNELLVRSVVAFQGLSEADVIRAAAIAERKQTHPIAKTILKKAAELELDVPNVDDFNYTIGFGISVLYAGALIQVGSPNFLRREGISLEPVSQVQEEVHERGHVLVLVAIDRAVCGAIELEAALRPELPGMLAALRNHGVTHTAIVSGDQEIPTQRLAEALGVDGYYAGVLPDRKAEIVERLQQEGRVVCFIGDGVNDSVAMKKADVSISLLGASSFAMDAAQIVLMDADLGLANLGRLFELTRGLDRNLRNSLYITLASSIINIEGALFVEGYDIYSAYIIKQLALAAGLGNAMRPLRQGEPSKGPRPTAHALQSPMVELSAAGNAEQREPVSREPRVVGRKLLKRRRRPALRRLLERVSKRD